MAARHPIVADDSAVGADVVDSERVGEEPGLVAAVAVVDVAHGRADVRVPHPCLDRGDLGPADGERAERVAQVMVMPTSA
jgi:hypothetical protein